jgi:predicted Zn-dependent protease
LYLGNIAAYLQYSRVNETEADQAGLERARLAGFDPRAAAGVWRKLIDENQASDFPSRRSEPVGSSIFSTHPINSARMLALTQAAQGADITTPDQTQERRRAYRRQIRPFLSAWLVSFALLPLPSLSQALESTGRASAKKSHLGQAPR